jgi:anthranilate phosphoribosyltransferase
VHRFIKAVGAGQKRARDLTRDEAREAMSLVIGGQAEPVQVGAFLLALRMKGESADEMAGFVDALMAGVRPVTVPPGTLDVDCHGDGHEGRSTLLPQAACALARLGVPVLLRTDLANPYAKHGMRQALDELSLPPGVTVLDLPDYCPSLARLVALRPLFGVRTVAQTLMKLLAPAEVASRMVGVFHAPYLPSTARALARLYTVPSLCVQALGGLPEAAPGKVVRVARGDGEPETLDLRFLGPEDGVVAAAALMLYAARGTPLPEAAEQVRQAFPSH